MAKKKQEEEHENLERWMVSYADFMTLLFATFVVLYALSQLDLAKFKLLKSSLQKAFQSSPTIFEGRPATLENEGDKITEFHKNESLIPPILDAIAAREDKENFESAQEELKKKNIDKLKGITTEITERGLVVKMVGNIFFESGTSSLKRESVETLREIGIILKSKFQYNLIRVEGHSDSQQMSSQMFPSNWELSAYRAAAVARYLIATTGIDKDRFSVVSYGDSKPIASNDTEAGRSENRRVEIVILSTKASQSELKTFKFEQERLKRLEEIKKMYERRAKQREKMSDAARQLMQETGATPEGTVIIQGDDYKQESQKILQELKRLELETDDKTKQRMFLESVKGGFTGKKRTTDTKN